MRLQALKSALTLLALVFTEQAFPCAPLRALAPGETYQAADMSGVSVTDTKNTIGIGTDWSGNGRFCSSAGTSTSPSGCTLLCSSGSCTQPHQTSQCSGPPPPSSGTYACALRAGDPNAWYRPGDCACNDGFSPAAPGAMPDPGSGLPIAAMKMQEELRRSRDSGDRTFALMSWLFERMFPDAGAFVCAGDTSCGGQPFGTPVPGSCYSRAPVGQCGRCYCDGKDSWYCNESEGTPCPASGGGTVTNTYGNQRCVPNCSRQEQLLGLSAGSLKLNTSTGKCECTSGGWNGSNCSGGTKSGVCSNIPGEDCHKDSTRTSCCQAGYVPRTLAPGYTPPTCSSTPQLQALLQEYQRARNIGDARLVRLLRRIGDGLCPSAFAADPVGWCGAVVPAPPGAPSSGPYHCVCPSADQPSFHWTDGSYSGQTCGDVGSPSGCTPYQWNCTSTGSPTGTVAPDTPGDGTQVCVPDCSGTFPGSTFDTSAGRCACTGGRVPNSTSTACVCPASAPAWDAGTRQCSASASCDLVQDDCNADYSTCSCKPGYVNVPRTPGNLPYRSGCTAPNISGYSAFGTRVCVQACDPAQATLDTNSGSPTFGMCRCHDPTASWDSSRQTCVAPPDWSRERCRGAEDATPSAGLTGDVTANFANPKLVCCLNGWPDSALTGPPTSGDMKRDCAELGTVPQSFEALYNHTGGTVDEDAGLTRPNRLFLLDSVSGAPIPGFYDRSGARCRYRDPSGNPVNLTIQAQFLLFDQAATARRAPPEVPPGCTRLIRVAIEARCPDNPSATTGVQYTAEPPYSTVRRCTAAGQIFLHLGLVDLTQVSIARRPQFHIVTTYDPSGNQAGNTLDYILNRGMEYSKITQRQIERSLLPGCPTGMLQQPDGRCRIIRGP